MPHRIDFVDPKLRVAPGIMLRPGEAKFKLLDSAGNPVVASPVEFHVGYGGGFFTVPAPVGPPPPGAPPPPLNPDVVTRVAGFLTGSDGSIVCPEPPSGNFAFM